MTTTMHMDTERGIVSVRSEPCGCSLVGEGTRADPLRIHYCYAHGVLSEIHDAIPAVIDGHARHAETRARKVTAEGELLSGVLREIAPALPAVLGPKMFDGILSEPETLCLHRDARFTTASGSVTPEWAAERFGLGRILEALADRLDDARGHAKSAEKAEKKLAIVEACLTLLSKGER